MAIEDIVRPLEAEQIVQENWRSDPSPMNMDNFNKFTEQMIEDKSIPEDIKNEFWFLDKELAITNLTEKDVSTIMNMKDITSLTEMMSKPDYELDWIALRQFDNLSAKTFIKSKRSVGALERRLLATQIRQVITEPERRQAQGMMSKIGNFLGLGGKR